MAAKAHDGRMPASGQTRRSSVSPISAIHQTVESMMRRANELNLRLSGAEERVKEDFLVLLTVQTMNYLHSGRHRVAL